MKQIKNAILRLVKEEDGAAASEYAVLVALIVAAVAAAVSIFDIKSIYTLLNTKITAAMNPTP